MLEFCGNKGIKQEYSNARTPQQNGVAERMNRTLIEAARTMLADSLLPTTFWAEAVSTACYIFNRGYRWMFDIDYLTDSMNYIPVSLENQANPHAGASEVTNSAGTSQTPYSNASEERDEDVELIVVPSTVKNTEEKAESRKSSTNSKKEEILTEPQQEKKASSTDTSEDNPKILAFRKELEEIALKHLGKVSGTSCLHTPSVNTDIESFILVVKALYGLHQAPRAWYATLSTFLEKHGYKRVLVDVFEALNEKQVFDEFYGCNLTFFLGLQVKQNKAGIFISQDKYVAEILKKFDLVNVKTAITPMETKVALTKDKEAVDVDVHLYRSMIGSLMYLTASRPDIMYATIVATSTTEAEYVAAANCCGQVLWVQNQLLDYGFNFMNTKIHIDNESTSASLKNTSTNKHVGFLRSLNEVPRVFAEIVRFSKRFNTQNFTQLMITYMYTITEASIRNKLQLADASGIIMLPNNEIFEGMGHMGCWAEHPDVVNLNIIIYNSQYHLHLYTLVQEVKIARRYFERRNVVLSDPEEEEPEDQGMKREEQVEDISPTTLEAAKTLSRVASQNLKSIDKGRRYKRRKETKGKKVVTSLDFQEEVSTGYAEGVNTGSIKVSTVSRQVSGQVNTDSIKKSIPSPDKGQREGKSPMIIEEAPKKTKEKILQEEASLAEAIRLDTLEKEE
ncbi:putative ribonuclease H-like domain-containing protein [Tanacetum coccineum]|uniref:Ribonuclease H-like domain-containing protein n=1 Tax=Tanacetum coccineum TaxID=301880 RepID=A0ABQ5CHG5_9ASTR